jgi:hypothetical protein
MKQATGMSRKFRICPVATVSELLKSVSWSLLEFGQQIFFLIHQRGTVYFQT